MVVRSFFISLFFPFKGLIFWTKNSSLWIPSLIPLILGLCFSVLSLINLWHPEKPELWYYQLLYYAYESIVYLGIFLVQIYIALAAPLFDWISEKTELALKELKSQSVIGVLADLFRPAFWKDSKLVFIEALKLLGFKIVIWLMAFGFSYIPEIGNLIKMILIGFVTGIDFLDYCLARKRLSLGEKLRFVSNHWYSVIPFCFSVFALLATPLLGGLMLVPCVIAGTMLIHEAKS